MSLQIIYGLGSSGKTEKLIQIAEETLNTSENKVFFIVPEQYSYEIEKKIASRLGVISPKTVEVLSFKRLFYYVSGHLGGSLLPRLTDTGREILIAKATEKCEKEFKILGKSAKYKGFTKVLSILFSEFKRYNITADKLRETFIKLNEDEFLRQKLEDISLVYKAYQEELLRKFIDADDELSLLAEILKEHNDFFADSIILIDEFEGFTPQEMTIITQIAKQAKEMKITLCTNTLVPAERSIFSMQAKTAASLDDIAQQYGIEAYKPHYMGDYGGRDKSISHLEKCLKNNSYEKFEEKSNVSIMFSINRTGEIEQIAEKIIEYIRDEEYRYRDFCIVKGNGDEYDNLIATVFKRYDIPVYLSSKTPLIELAPAKALLYALLVIINKWRYNDVFTLLKTGFSNAKDDEIDLLENYVIKTGIRGDSWKKDWIYVTTGPLDEINNIRQKITEPLIKLENSINVNKTVRQYIKALVSFMRDSDFYNKIDGIAKDIDLPDISEKYNQAYEMIIDSFDDIESVCKIDEEISLQSFYSMLEAALSSKMVGNIPTSVDSVTVADATRCRARKSKIMFIVGTCDGEFPRVYTGEGIITDEEREYLESNHNFNMAPSTIQKTYDEDFIVYSTLTHPDNKLFLSYPLTNNKGDSLVPSMLIKRVKAIFPEMEEIENVTTEKDAISDINSPISALYKYAEKRSNGTENTLWSGVGSWLENSNEYRDKLNKIKKAEKYKNKTESISEENLEKLYGENVYTSVSRLEAYRKCPFMYFVKYTLGAKERESTEFKTVDTGTIMHSIMEKLSLSVADTFGSWKETEDLWIEKTVENIARTELENIENSLDVIEPRQLWAFERLKSTVVNSAKIVAKHLKSGEFMPMGYEISFDDDSKYGAISFKVNGKTVKLRGKVDRSDMYVDEQGRKFIRIIDYKSGNKFFKVEELLYGMNLQLAVYLDSLSSQEDATCAGMLYFRLYDHVLDSTEDIDTKEAENGIEKLYKTHGLVVADKDILSKMDKNLETENSYLNVSINKDGSFGKYSDIATYEQFEAMSKYVNKVVSKMCSQMLKGKTDIFPYKMGDSTPCTYCEFKKACFFDGECGNRYNYLEKVSRDDAWMEIMKEVDGNARMDKSTKGCNKNP